MKGCGLKSGECFDSFEKRNSKAKRDREREKETVRKRPVSRERKKETMVVGGVCL